MSISQFKAKYAGSALGVWWALITPIILAVCISLIFSVAFKVKMPNYAMFILSGIIPWIFFTNVLNESLNSFIANYAVLRQSAFPREFIPISCVLSNLLSLGIGFVFLLPLFIISHRAVAGQLFGLFSVVCLHFLFVLGLGLFCSTINVFFRDLSHFLSIGFMIWFWLTPIFYSLEMLQFPLRWLCLLNPMTYYVLWYKQVLFYAQLPAAWIMFAAFLLSLASLSLGYLFFVKKEPLLLKKI